MKLTPLIQKAINTASLNHCKHDRKTDGNPYIVHPFAVALIISTYTQDQDVICAALLHDFLEEIPGYDFKKMEKEFNKNIAVIVEQISEDKDPRRLKDQKASWLSRKEGYLKKLEVAGQSALLICVADKIHNITSLLMAYENRGDKIWEKFNAPKEKKIWFYKAVLEILEKRLKSPLVDELAELIKKIS